MNRKGTIMIKRYFIFFIVVCLLASSIPVYADVIMLNEFQRDHKYETQRLDRGRFIVNGQFGTVTTKKEPDFMSVDANTYKNGEELFITNI